MRLLMLTADYPPGTWSGIGLAALRQANALAAAGVDVHVLTTAQMHEGFVNELTVDTLVPTVHHLARGRCPVNPAEFDAIHLHSLSLSELALEMRRRFDLPLIYTAHSLLWRERLENAARGTVLSGRDAPGIDVPGIDAPGIDVPGIDAPGIDVPGIDAWERVQHGLLALSEHVIFLSRDEHRTACAWLSGLRDRSSVIPNGIKPVEDVSQYQPMGPLLFAGRFARSKGVELLADLIPAAVARWNCQFVLAGGHGDAVGERVVARLRKRIPAENLQIFPWLSWPQVERQLRQASLLLVPSLYEPFGQGALEAMALGTPVLAAATGGLLDLVTPDSGGVLVHRHEPENWLAQLAALRNHPQRLRILSQQGPQSMSARFNIYNVAAHLIATYRGVRRTRGTQPLSVARH